MPSISKKSSVASESAGKDLDLDLNDFEALNRSLSEVTELIGDLSPKSTFEKSMKNIIGLIHKHVQILANSCSELSNTVDSTEIDIAKTDQYSRRNTLVVSGLEYKKETETYNNLCSTVAEELTTSGIKVTSTDFSACHRNGNKIKTITKKGKQVKVPPTVTVKFYNSNKKDNVMNNYKNYHNRKPKSIRVVQSLNNYYQNLKSNICNFCRDRNAKIVWLHWRSASSGLCVKFDDGTYISKIHSMANFTKQFINTDL